ARELVLLFGEHAVRRVLPLLESPKQPGRMNAIQVLLHLAPYWSYDKDLGPFVCRAALAYGDQGLSNVCDLIKSGRPAVRCIAAELAARCRRDGTLWKNADHAWHQL